MLFPHTKGLVTSSTFDATESGLYSTDRQLVQAGHYIKHKTKSELNPDVRIRTFSVKYHMPSLERALSDIVHWILNGSAMLLMNNQISLPQKAFLCFP